MKMKSKRNHTHISRWLSLLALVVGLTACRGVLDVQIAQVQPAPAASLGKVAYIAGGDVWLVDLDTAQHTRLTRDGRNSYPQWSADGRWIAYLKRDELWASDATGEEQRVSEFPVYAFAWSPSENQLAYLTSAGGLALWDADGVNQSLRLADTAYSLPHLAWSPDGRTLAYEIRGTVWGIGQVPLEEGAPLAGFVTNDSMALPNLTGWTPDGAAILAWFGPDSALYKIDGLPLCLIPGGTGEPRCLEERVLLWPDFVSWSPLGQLAFIGGAGRETWVNKGLSITVSDTLETRRLVDSAEQAPLQPAWSPRAERIAYSAGPPTPLDVAYERRDEALAQRRIWLVEVANGRRRQLTGDARYRDERPLWSSNGGHILFARLSEEGAGLWLMAEDGDDLRRVVPELTPRPDPISEYGYIDWSALWDWWRPN
jgi:dipeptidyl aminopeptidase/acylaminoacyl peptidase